jgi:pimeloyl-ACP methyl ester carboxylesterase
VLLLHGLAGHAGEWVDTAAGLIDCGRVLALDQRGHGRRETHPIDVSRDAFVADVGFVIDALELAPVVLVGQSMGANTAFLVATAFPERVAGLVVADASPDGPAPDLREHIRQWLERWPVPFAGVEQARGFFTAQGLEPGPWIAGLQTRGGGLWPAFNNTVMVDCIADLAARDYWAQWHTIRCPTLIVRGEHGNLPPEHAEQLARALPDGQTVTISNAGHDVHLQNTVEWVLALKRFLHGDRTV